MPFTKEEHEALQSMTDVMDVLSKWHWFFVANGYPCVMRYEKPKSKKRAVNNDKSMNSEYIASRLENKM